MASSIICVGDLEIRPREHTVLVNGHEVALTSREFEIVSTLAAHPGWVFSASQLAGEASESDYSPESVSVLISRLRQKLAVAGTAEVVETVRGFGYRLHVPSDASEETALLAGARRELRDALWQLQEAVIEAEHSGSPDQQATVRQILEQTRRSIHSTLAE